MYDKISLKIPFIILVVAGALYISISPPPKGPGAEAEAKAPEYFGRMRFGDALQPGTVLVYDVPDVSSKNDADLAKKIIERRVNASGLKEIRVTASGDKTLTVKLPQMSDSELRELRRLIEEMGRLSLKLDAPQEVETRWRASGVVPDGYGEYISVRRPQKDKQGSVVKDEKTGKVLYQSRTKYLLKTDKEIRGDQIVVARPDTSEGKPVVAFGLDANGKKILSELTKQKGRRLVILLNDEVVSAPTIQAHLTTGGGIITLGSGRSDQARQERDELIIFIKAGSLQSKLEPQYQFTTGAGLGEDQIDKGKKTIIAAFAFVIVFMVLYYLGAGIVADIALLVNLILVVGLMCWFKATFTLSGIAGLILTVGMSVDANILIFERIREEKKKGRTLRQAVKNGYDRAFRTIVDANVTTLLTAAILYWMGSPEIKGFAVVLGLGILCSMFTALFITKVVFTVLIRAKIFRSVKMLKLIGQPRIAFTKMGNLAMGVSAIAIVIGLVAFFSRGTDNFGIDFLGGARYHIVLKKSLPIKEVRTRVTQALGSHANVQLMEPMEIEVDGKKQPALKNTEYTISLVKTDMDALAQKHAADFPELEKVTARNREIVKEMIRAEFKEELVPEGSETRIHPNLGKMTFSLTHDISSGDAAKIRAALLAEGQDYEEENISLPLPGSEKKTTRFVIHNVEFTDQKTFAARVEAIREALGRQDKELRLDPKNPAALAFEEQGSSQILFFTRQVEITSIAEATDEAMQRAFQKEFEAEEEKGSDVQGTFEVLGTTVMDLPAELKPNERNFVSVSVDVRYTDVPDAVKLPFPKVAALLGDRMRIPDYVRISSGSFARAEYVGEAVAKGFKRDAFYSILLAMIVIVGYIWMRFRQLRYGLAAVVALTHDVLFTMGALAGLAYLGVEVKIDLAIIAAFLTIVGYSLNDTIVVFDRIRENTADRHAKHYQEDVNLSINQTLSRTILTSLTTLMVVTILAVFGGAGVIRGFAIAMIVGVLVGTYSSIFIASPVVVWFHKLYQGNAQGGGIARLKDRAAL